VEDRVLHQEAVKRVKARPAALFATLAAAVLFVSPVRAAEPTVEECVSANERSVPLRKAGKLREARAGLLRCSAASCPAAVRDDCIAEATRLERALPSLVFAVKDAAGNDLTAVRITMDGQPFAERLDGTALDADPGEHVFLLTAQGQTVERKLLVREGEKSRREQITIGTAAGTPAAPAAPAAPAQATAADGGWGTQKTAGIALVGLGVVSIGVGSVFGVLAGSSWDSAKTKCGTGCAPGSDAYKDKDTANTNATVANIGFGVGLAALIGGGALWYFAPANTPAKAARISPLVGNGMLGLGAQGVWP
jgi:hypothetical protein